MSGRPPRVLTTVGLAGGAPPLGLDHRIREQPWDCLHGFNQHAQIIPKALGPVVVEHMISVPQRGRSSTAVTPVGMEPS